MADVDYTRSLRAIKASVTQTSYPPSRYAAPPPPSAFLNPAPVLPITNNRPLTGKSESKTRGNKTVSVEAVISDVSDVPTSDLREVPPSF